MKLSILILTIESRAEQYGQLRIELIKQMRHCAKDIELVTIDGNYSIGRKRNKALESSQGDYVCFIDDDDTISENYIELLMNAIDSGCDCASLKGVITTDGANPYVFEHSIKYKEWKTNEKVITLDKSGWDFSKVKYERFPNHLNAIRRSIAEQFKFPDKNFSEDFDWSTQLHNSGLLKTEHYISEIIYYYKFISNKENANV